MATVRIFLMKMHDCSSDLSESSHENSLANWTTGEVNLDFKDFFLKLASTPVH